MQLGIRVGGFVSCLPAIERPIGNQLRERCAGCGVSILVLSDVQTFGASGFDFLEDARRLPPRAFAAELDVRDFRANVRLTCNVKNFVERGINPVILMPHVAGVDTVEGCDFLGEFHDLIRAGKSSRPINQSRGKPHRAVLHGPADDDFHLLPLGGCRLAVEAAAHRLATDGVVADERCDVEGNFFGLDVLK